MLDYYNDNQIKFEHTPVTNNFAFETNTVGADAGIDIDEATHTYTDANSIFVSDTTGNDSTGDGDQATPYKTILVGINNTTATRTYVVVLDSATYDEDISGGTFTHLTDLVAATGQTPVLSHRTLDYTPADANTIYMASTGDDANAGTSAAPKLTLTGAAGAISACDAAHQKVVIKDSSTYSETDFAFTGNFLGLYAAIGHNPTIKPSTYDHDVSDYNDKQVYLAAKTLEDCNTVGMGSGALLNGNAVVLYENTGTQLTKFKIVDSDGNVQATTTIYSGGGTLSWWCLELVVLTGGNFVCVFSPSNDGDLYSAIYEQDGTEVQAATKIYTGTINQRGIALTALNNGNWVVVYSDSVQQKTYFEIYDEDGTQVKASTQIEADEGLGIAACTLSNDNWVACYRAQAGADSNLVIYDEDGNNVKAVTQFDANDLAYPACTPLNTGGWMCIYSDSIDGDTNLITFASDGTVVTAKTQILNGYSSANGITTMQNGDVFLCFSQQASNTTYFQIREEDGTSVVGSTLIQAADAGSVEPVTLTNGMVFVGYEDDDNTLVREYIYYPYSWSFAKVSSASTINGITFDGEDDYLLTKLIQVDGAKPTIRWCEFKGCTNPTITTVYGYAIHGDNETDIYNCKFYDNDAAICLTANKVIIHDSQFYRNTAQYAIDIDGAAASSGDITIEHCDVYNNYGGIRLQNNNGTNEIVKNLIIHNNDNYGIYADTSVTYSYSTNTDSTSGASAGSSVVLANPLYLNEGATDPTAIDLNIKTQIEGYPADSPAKDLADDTRNAGSFNVQYIGLGTTWTAITIDKPPVIDVWYEPVGESKSVNMDGSVETGKDGQTEYVSLKWDALDTTDFPLLLTMWKSSTNTVRLYPDPTTNANDYNTYKLIYGKLNAGVNYYKLSEHGYEKPMIVLARAYS